jgi:hypothetical protein
MDAYIAPAFGALVLLALGILIQLLRDIGARLTTLGENLVRLATEHTGLVEDVRDLQERMDAIDRRRPSR